MRTSTHIALSTLGMGLLACFAFAAYMALPPSLTPPTDWPLTAKSRSDYQPHKHLNDLRYLIP